MIKFQKSTSYLMVLLLLLTCLIGCTPNADQLGESPSEGGEETTKDTITLLIQSEPATLDSAYANNDNITIVLQFIHENLFALMEDGSVEPELLESYEIVDDTTVTFKLKEGVLFSDGNPLTAEDVFWAIERCQASPVSQSHFRFVDLAKSEIQDDHNFTLKFAQAWAPFMNTMSTGRGSIPCKAAFEEMGEQEFARNPVGCGPYKVKEWVSGTQIELVRNENYHGEPAKTENVIIKFVPEPSARVIELETGAADIAYYIEGSDIQRVEGIDGYHIESGESYQYFTLVFSMTDDYLKDERVREALTLAIDREELTSAASMGLGTPIYGYAPKIMQGYVDMGKTEQDIDKAKELLADAGYPDGFTIDLHVEPQPIIEKSAEIVQGMWSQIGVNANIVKSPLETYDGQKNGQFQASIRDGTATELSNVLIIYESTFGSRMNGNDDWLDEKLLELRTYYYGDPARDEFIQEVMDYIKDKNYTFPYMVMPTIYAVRDDLDGFIFHPAQDHMNIKNWAIQE